MASAAVFGCLIGLLVGMRWRVFALVPLELCGLLTALGYSAFHGLAAALSAFAVGSLALQAGYVLASVSQRHRPARLGQLAPEPHP